MRRDDTLPTTVFHATLGMAALLATVVGSLSCTEAQLYGKDFEPNFANRISFRGDLCTDDPSALDFPVKILVVMDTTSPGVGAGPQRVTALKALLSRFEGPNRYFGLVQMGAQARSVTRGFATDTQVLDGAVETIGQSSANPQRNYLDALRMSATIISDDMMASNPGIRSRTRYVLLFVAEAGPTPPLAEFWCPANGLEAGGAECKAALQTTFCSDEQPPPADCEGHAYVQSIVNLRTFVQANGAQDFAAHTFSLGGDARADELLSALALAGRGEAVKQTPATLNLLAADIVRPTSRFVLRDIVVANANAVLRGEHPVPDSDGDGLSDEEEARLGTDPANADTDGDGVGDAVERGLATVGSAFDPLAIGKPPPCQNLVEPYVDTDLDGLNDCEEAVLRTSPFLIDTDRDGVPDAIEALRGGNPLVDDRLTDSDQDGIPNGEELRAGLDPLTNDAARDLENEYLYRVVDEGATQRLEATPPDPIAGIEIRRIVGASPGVALLRIEPGPPLMVAWGDDANIGAVGAAAAVDRRQVVTLRSGNSNSEVDVEVDPTLLTMPTSGPKDVRVFVRPTERTCFYMDVRNITLVETLQVPGRRAGRGWNLLQVYLGEVPIEWPEANTVYRAFTMPVRFTEPNHKTPNVAFVTLEQKDLLLLSPK